MVLYNFTTFRRHQGSYRMYLGQLKDTITMYLLQYLNMDGLILIQAVLTRLITLLALDSVVVCWTHLF